MKPYLQCAAGLAALLCAPVALPGLDAAPVEGATARLTVHADQTGPRISPTLYGIFFEEINCAGDGGIYAEMVRNRSFEDSNKPDHWSLVSPGDGQGEMAIEALEPQEGHNGRCLKLTVVTPGEGVGVENAGYWGMAVKAGQTYRCSLQAKAADDFAGTLAVSLRAKDGTVLARQVVPRLGEAWQTYELALVPKATDASVRLVVSASASGTVWLDMVSLFPHTWKNRPNGLRPDLARMLADLKPGFMRFPGGCWVEGDTLKYAYRWKETIGEPAERRNQYNIWRYYSTHGLGFHEYLQMAEDLGAEPLFVINCGMSHKEVVPLDQMGEWVQDALDAIEYANGPADSQWGSVRARNGHPAPFHLRYMEIGNENGGRAYHERYALFHDAIKAKYPEMRLVADVWGGTPGDRPLEIVDEHYYNNPRFFIENAGRYDRYDRNGPKVYVGEYAVTQNAGQGNLSGALAEAAFMTGMERNSDVVVMSSYAPLFANVNYKRWNPDLINFDSAGVYGTPSYYVQRMFGQNRGDVVLPIDLEVKSTQPEEMAKGGIGLATWNTQAEYKDVTVTHDGRTLFKSDFSKGSDGWRIRGGEWKTVDGAFQQLARGDDRRAVIGDPSWTDYTLHLKARKISGAEGFLIMFHVRDENNWLWWNLGGWGNQRHAIERCDGGGKSTIGNSVDGGIETGRWYDVRVEVSGHRIRCYLDDKLVHDVTDERRFQPVHAVASRVEDSGDIVLKVVNAGDVACRTNVRLDGVASLDGQGALTCSLRRIRWMRIHWLSRRACPRRKRQFPWPGRHSSTRFRAALSRSCDCTRSSFSTAPKCGITCGIQTV